MSDGLSMGYTEAVLHVKDYYEGAALEETRDIWYKIETNQPLTSRQIADLKEIPDLKFTYTKSGKIGGLDWIKPYESIPDHYAATVNSNIPNSAYRSGSFSNRINGYYSWDGQYQRGTFRSGARTVSTGTRVMTVANKVGTAVAAVSIGMQLGAKIDSALYNVGKFFDLNPPEALNPETWPDIASSEGGKDLIRTLFGIDDGKTTMYMPEDAINYMYRYWLEQGMFDMGTDASLDDPEVEGIPQPIPVVDGNTIFMFPNGDTAQYRNAEKIVIMYDGTHVQLLPISRQTIAPIEISNDGGQTWIDAFTFTGTTLVSGSSYQYNTYTNRNALPTNIATGNIYYIPSINSTTISKVGTTVIDGTITQTGIPGVDKNPTSQLVDPAQVGDNKVTDAYPDIFRNPIKESVPQPDGSTKDIIYYPVPWPNTTDMDRPTSDTSDQTTPYVDDDSPDEEKEPLTDIITNPNPSPETPVPSGPATPPDTGTGSTPTIVPPTGEASSLWAIYNPTQAQLDAFGSWLWSSDFVEQIKKLFNDPMQAIVGVHKVFATPSTGEQVNIKCGYIDSGCPAAKVTSQYTTVNCGTVSLREYYGNVLDYAPYTKVSLYLPFIGIVDLDVADVMRSSINVTYHVDVITGACLADVKVSRDGENAVLYQYSGSAIVTYPISSGSYASMVTGVLSLAAGVAGTIMTGGAAAPALIGGAVGLSHLHTDVQKSGGFSGAPGAMGCKKPYLIVSRAQDNTPSNFQRYEGKPASKTVKIGDCSGFIKVKSINIDAVPATYGELDQIVALLKQGVIL